MINRLSLLKNTSPEAESFIINPPEDSGSQLQERLQFLVGQPFLHFRFSYGDELMIHLGAPHPYRWNSKLTKGSFVIGSRASHWVVQNPPFIYYEEADGEEDDNRRSITPQMFEGSHLITPGAQVSVVKVIPLETSWGLALAFTDGSSVMILPSGDQCELSDWEVFAPDGIYLEIGPGLEWNNLDSTEAKLD